MPKYPDDYTPFEISAVRAAAEKNRAEQPHDFEAIIAERQRIASDPALLRKAVETARDAERARRQGLKDTSQRQR